jgi:16S rRNA (uracil1498-N3)-methyltransferase
MDRPMRRFLSTSLPSVSNVVYLDAPQSHHMLRVVGIAVGEQIELVDGKGKACLAILQAVENSLACVAWVAEITVTSTTSKLSLALSLTKGDAFSLALRMATELGVHAIFPMITERSIAKGDKPERWQKIVESACLQSKRAEIPVVHELHKFTQLFPYVQSLQNTPTQYCILHTATHQSLQAIQQDTLLCIGPEGGFSPKEVEFALQQGCVPMSLGGTILRADTAVVAATALALQAP